jgi:uncharacterized protein
LNSANNVEFVRCKNYNEGMTRFILLGLIVTVFVFLVRTLFPSSSGKGESAKEMVKDPNCETYVPEAEALRKVVAGQDHYFCSEKCAEEYSRKNA